MADPAEAERLAATAMTERAEAVHLNSSNLLTAQYDETARVLTVTFRGGGAYEYAGVDADTASGLLSSTEPGVYFARHIKSRFQTRKI